MLENLGDNLDNGEKYYKSIENICKDIIAKNKTKKYLLIIRHGQTPGNKKDVLGGTTNYDLTEDGKRQAKEMNNMLYPYLNLFRFICSSPRLRAIKTAEIACGSKLLDKYEGEDENGKPISTDPYINSLGVKQKLKDKFFIEPCVREIAFGKSEKKGLGKIKKNLFCLFFSDYVN